MLVGDIEDVAFYLFGNGDHYEFQLELVDGFPTLNSWLETRYTIKQVNRKLTNLLDAYKNMKEFVDYLIFDFLDTFGIRTSSFTIYDIGYGEIMIKTYYYDVDDNIFDDVYIIAPRKGRWKGWEPINRVFPDCITII